MDATNHPEVKNYVNGEFTRNGQTSMNVLNPATGDVISTLPMSTYNDVDEAVKAAQAAFPAWSAMTTKDRALIFFRYRALLEKHKEELTELIHIENGKTLGESRAEIEKSMPEQPGAVHPIRTRPGFDRQPP